MINSIDITLLVLGPSVIYKRLKKKRKFHEKPTNQLPS